MIGVLHLPSGGGFGWRTHAWLATFQLFDITPALFRFWRQAGSGDFAALKRLSLFFLRREGAGWPRRT